MPMPTFTFMKNASSHVNIVVDAIGVFAITQIEVIIRHFLPLAGAPLFAAYASNSS
jgi:hypothetical protein